MTSTSDAAADARRGPGAELGEAARCSAPYRVRFEEAGPDGLIRTSTLLRYAQDLAWFHSAQRGFTRGWYAERGLAWLARAAAVGIDDAVGVGSELTGTTVVVGARRVWARRRTEFVDADDHLVAWTQVDWVLLDARGAPTRIPPEIDGAFDFRTLSVPLARVDLPPTPLAAALASFDVRPHELDPMGHANNAVYADWLEERVMAADAASGPATTRAIPRTVRLEYARAAEPGMTITAATWRDADGGWACRLSGPGGEDLLRARIDPPVA